MFKDLAKQRYSVRKYSQKPVEEEKLQSILEVGRLSPTAANLQPQKIYVLKSEEAMNKARNFTKMMFNAPLALLVCYDDDVSWTGDRFGEPEYDGGEVDASIVTTSMMMEATDLGLGTLWVRGFNSKEAAKVFELPQNMKPVCFLLIGYPDEDSEPSTNHTKRKELSETVEVL